MFTQQIVALWRERSVEEWEIQGIVTFTFRRWKTLEANISSFCSNSCPESGVLEYWSTGVLEYWSTGGWFLESNELTQTTVGDPVRPEEETERGKEGREA